MRKLGLALLCANLFACGFMTDDEGVFRDRRYDYRNAETQTDRITVPADLDSEAIVDYYVIPPMSPYADTDLIYTPPLPTPMISDQGEVVKLQRLEGNVWILARISPSQLWPRLKQFLGMQSLVVTAENGGLGLVDSFGIDGVYRFKVEQGFQRNTSEISVRYLSSAESANSFWPESSDDADKEQEIVGKLAQFIAEVSDSPAYSFAAQGISTQKKMQPVNYDGQKTLLLNVPKLRAAASVKLALENADFKIDEQEQSLSGMKVQYWPKLPDAKKPGFWGRLFGKSADDYDEDVEYAGEFYRININDDGAAQRVSVTRLSDKEVTTRQANRESNTVIQLIQGHIY
jgi:outer membrane protein assembly factor BamC